MKELIKLKKWLENRLQIAKDPSTDAGNIKWEIKAEAYEDTIKRIEEIESESFSIWYKMLTDEEKENYCKIYWLNKEEMK